MLDASLVYKKNMTGLERSGHHITYELINMLLRLRLEPGSWAQTTYKTLHKGWSMIWCYFLDTTKYASERYIEADMTETRGNCSYDEKIKLKRYPLPPESTYHKFMGVMKDYTDLELTVWRENYDH